jgi:hypothetical protein
MREIAQRLESLGHLIEVEGAAGDAGDEGAPLTPTQLSLGHPARHRVGQIESQAQSQRQQVADTLGTYFQHGQRLVGEAREVAAGYKLAIEGKSDSTEAEIMGPVAGIIHRATLWFEDFKEYIERTLSPADQARWWSSVGLPEPAIGFDAPESLVRCFAGIWNRLVRTQELIAEWSR